MGFSKAKAQQEVPVAIHFVQNTYQDSPGGGPPVIVDTSEVDVVHYLRLPSVSEREQYNRLLISTKGKRVITNITDASWFLWSRCCVRVSGYDDLPEDGDWRAYFEDEVGRAHVEAVVTRFNDLIGGEDVELEKKFVPSSAQ